MKKLIYLLLIASLAMLTHPIKVQAQAVFKGHLHSLPLATGYLRDTVGASETGLLYFNAALPSEGFKVGWVEIQFLKISGAPAASATLEASIYGTDWAQVHDSTFTVANSSGDQSMGFRIVDTHAQYYRVKAVATSATQSFSMRGDYLIRK